MSKIVSDPRLPTVNDEKIRPLTQRLYELFRQYAIAHNKSYMWDTEGTAAPTTGTWSISQMCKNTNPSSNVPTIIGWVCIASGTPGTWIEITGGGVREVLTSSRTYYVRTDGSDSNNGLSNTSVGAFLTIQKAVDTVCNRLDIQSYDVTIQIADGTYTSGCELKDIHGNGIVTIKGNTGTPSNVVISTTSAHAIIAGQYTRGYWIVKDLKIITTTSGFAIYCQRGSFLTYSNIDFGACASGHLHSDAGTTLICVGDYGITGSAPTHFSTQFGGYLGCNQKTITITGTPAFSNAFAYATNGGQISSTGCTFSGSATGVRYSVVLNGVIDTGGGGANYFPGGTAGTPSATGGQYY